MIDVKVPSLGESISQGVLAKWAAADGAYVTKGDLLFELETDKATSEVNAPESGVVRHKVEEGAEVAVGAVVATIEPGEKPASAKQDARISREEKPAAREAGSEQFTAKNEKVIEEQLEAKPVERVSATSIARKIAEEKNVDLTKVKGTGPGGRITREDVEAHLQAPPPEPKVAPTAPKTDEGQTREKMSTLRKRIAARLVEAQHNAAMLTTFNDVDMSAVNELRAKYKDSFKERHGIGLGFMSFFTKACVEALKQFPRANAFIDGNDIVYNKRQHIGVAVSTDKGLIVPVIRNAGELSFAEIEKAIREYAIKAREGKIELDDLQGGTFTITNGGVFGSLLSTPILNPPQSAILGMHRIEDRPVAVNGQVVIRPMMYLALSYDHRIIDGREAVGFLVRVKECIENPARMLLEI